VKTSPPTQSQSATPLTTAQKKPASLAPLVACVTVPNFPIKVCLQDNRQLENRPLALVDNSPATELDSAEIIAVNQKAAEAGVLLNMTAAQGHIVCPDLEIKVRDLEKEIEYSNGIYKKLQSLSPFIEEACPGLYFLDAAGLDLLYRSDQEFAEKIIATVKSHQISSDKPIPLARTIKLGLAKNKFVARVAADIAPIDHFTIVSPGEEPQFLRPLPIEHLQLPSEILATLHDLGLKTIGQLATFPANEMIRRFGFRGAALSRLARGDDTVFFDPAIPTEPLSCNIWLTAPVSRANTIFAHVEKLLSPLLDKLGCFSQGCCMVEIKLSLEDKSEHTIPITLERPTLSVDMFIRQLRAAMEKLNRTADKPSAAVTGIRVTIPAVSTLLTEQLPLETGLPTSSAVNNLPSGETALANNNTITVPVRRNLFLPEQRCSFSPLTARPRPTAPESHLPRQYFPLPYAAGKITGLRLFQPPREIEVTITNNRPVAIKQPIAAGQRRATRRPVAVNSLGPWELSGGWWSRRFDRLYWEIQTDNRQLYLIYLDRLSSRWFLQGVFD
jgi:hypothetical protein